MFVPGFVVNGINNVNTQSVERRFRLPSSRSGLISSSYDFAAGMLGLVCYATCKVGRNDLNFVNHSYLKFDVVF